MKLVETYKSLSYDVLHKCTSFKLVDYLRKIRIFTSFELAQLIVENLFLLIYRWSAMLWPVVLRISNRFFLRTLHEEFLALSSLKIRTF